MTHRHCRGPGCDRPIGWTQAAHLDPWTPTNTAAEPGRTDLDRTLPLCHHHLLDTNGWTATYDPDTAQITWTRPDGRYTTQTHPPDP